MGEVIIFWNIKHWSKTEHLCTWQVGKLEKATLSQGLVYVFHQWTLDENVMGWLPGNFIDYG